MLHLATATKLCGTKRVKLFITDLYFTPNFVTASETAFWEIIVVLCCLSNNAHYDFQRSGRGMDCGLKENLVSVLACHEG